MRLAALYNIWDGVELLSGSMNCMKDHVDYFIIVYQIISNFGEKYDPLPEIERSIPEGCHFMGILYQPDLNLPPAQNETQKRNSGIRMALQLGFTHFLHVDCDEYYQDFGKAKEQYLSNGNDGSVARIYTYFKKPIWRLENFDGYFVPFIHELRSDTKAGRSSYSFYCDPTRTINESSVGVIEEPMHHYSWIRKDIMRKARNSSASVQGNKLRGLLDDYYSPELEKNPEEYHIKDMGNQRIKIVDDIFGLSKIFPTNC